tara:strand:+ start:1823 stop:4090 length:2268 start_codon:yes stop_codon:yes gene_type:complete
MKEEDYFRDQRDRDRRSNFVGSYRRPGSSEFFNPAADILTGIEGLESSINKRKKTVSDFENAAAIRNQEIMSSIADMEGMEDSSALDSLQADLIAQAEELHRLDIASFEGDRSAYLKKSNQINKIANEIPALMGLIDAAGTTLEEAIMSGKGLDKSVLKSNKQDYYNFVDDARKGGKNISFRINENGNIIAQLNGQDVFNGSAYIKSKEKGFDLINYVKDYSKEMSAIDAEASKGLLNLISSSKIEEIKKRGKFIDTKEEKNYIEAANAYKKALERNIGIDAITNESTFQTFIGGEEPYQANKEQNAKTKEAIIDKMLRDKFPQAVIENGVVKSAIGNKSFTRKIDVEERRYQRQKELKRNKDNSLTLETKEQIKLLGPDYESFKQSFNPDPSRPFGDVNSPEFVAESLNQTAPEGTTYMSYDEVIKAKPDLEGKIEKNKVYIEKKNSRGKYDIVTSKPISIGEGQIDNLTAIKARDFGMNNSAISYFRSQGSDSSNSTIGNSRVPADQKKNNNQVSSNEVEPPVANTSIVVSDPVDDNSSNVNTTQAPDNTPVKTTPGNRDLAAENKKQEDLMRKSEVEYGGKSGNDTVGLPSYKDYDFQTYLNSKDQVVREVDGKGATYGKSGQPKRGLKTDLGEDVYSGLSDSQQSMMRMMHVNIPWDPRVVMLMATGDIKGKDNRSKYLGDYKATTELYNKNKAKFKNIDDQAMFDQWVDIYSRTNPNDPGYQKQYKKRVIDMAEAYGFKPTKEQLDKFKV